MPRARAIYMARARVGVRSKVKELGLWQRCRPRAKLKGLGLR